MIIFLGINERINNTVVYKQMQSKVLNFLFYALIWVVFNVVRKGLRSAEKLHHKF